MASVNKVILVGNLGKDPEIRYTQSGVAFCAFTMATTDTWTDQNNVRQERTEWHRITVWKKQAENCAKYLRKGSQAYVEGRLQTRSWDDQSGQKRYSTDIVADQVRFLSSPRQGNQEERATGTAGFVPPPYPSAEETSWTPQAGSLDSVPF